MAATDQRNRYSIKSIQAVQNSPIQQHKHSISLITTTPIDVSPITHAHPLPQSPERFPSFRERPQSQYLQQSTRTDLKHSRSQSSALFPLKRKEVPNESVKRAQSVLQPHQHIRPSAGSQTSEQSGMSGMTHARSGHTSQTSVTLDGTQQPAPSTHRYNFSQGYGHHAAVEGAVGYAPSTSEVTMNVNHQNNSPTFSKKIVVVGDGGSGKTCLLMRYKERTFPDKYVPTVFENYITMKHHPATGSTVEVALWDTAGQEEYDRLRPLSYPETDVILVCFAVDCPQSLDSVKEKWFPEVSHFCPTTPLILVGCKSDLRDNEQCIDQLEGQGLRPLTVDEGQSIARFIGAEAYIECSSKEMINVDEAFELAMDISIAKEIGGDWMLQQVGQQLLRGQMGVASQVSKRPSSGGKMLGGSGNISSKGAKVIGKKRKRGPCRIL